jgi:hypothetical protein
MKTTFFSLIALLLLLPACSTVSPNQFTLYTSDCWNHIEVVKAGDIMPTLNSPCKKMVTLPAFEMPGEVEVKTRFRGDVKGTIVVDYLYSITDPLAFVQTAKFLLQSNTENDDNSASNGAIEQAENTVIEKHVRDVVREKTETMDAQNFNESAFETDIVTALNSTALRKIGIQISAPSVRVVFGPATETAIDAVSAQSLFESHGMKEVGQEILKAQAGKPEISVTVQPAAAPKE